MYVACGLQAEGGACVPKWVYNVNDVIDQILKKKKSNNHNCSLFSPDLINTKAFLSSEAWLYLCKLVSHSFWLTKMSFWGFI